MGSTIDLLVFENSKSGSIRYDLPKSEILDEIEVSTSVESIQDSIKVKRKLNSTVPRSQAEKNIFSLGEVIMGTFLMMLFSYLGVLLSISFFIGSFVLFLLDLIGVPIFTYRRIWRIWKIDKDEPNYKLRRNCSGIYCFNLYNDHTDGMVNRDVRYGSNFFFVIERIM